MEKTHYAWIDYGKTVAIFLVVLLHTHCNTTVDSVINAFVMPVFFFMSGFVFSYDRNPHYGAFLYKRFRQLVVPYLWINVLAYLLWLFVLRHYGEDAGSDISWSTPLVGFLTGVPPLLSHDIPLWSLLCFFVVEAIFYPLCKTLMRDWVVAIIFLGLAYAMTLIADGSRLPLTLGPAITAVGFYALGHFYRSNAVKSGAIWSIAAVIGLIVSVGSNTEVEFFICNYGNFGLFLLGSFSGISLVVAATNILGKNINEPRAIKFIARSTLLICGFHLIAFAAIKGVMLLGFGIEPSMLTDSVSKGILFAATAFMLTLPVSYIVFRFFPGLVDK